jgi:hypothetical protein
MIALGTKMGSLRVKIAEGKELKKKMQRSFCIGDRLGLRKRLGLVIVVVDISAASFVYKQLYREQSFLLSLVCVL